MNKLFVELYNILTSKETWEKALYFARGKDPHELKREIKTEDIVPIILSLIITVVGVLILIGLFKTIGWLFNR